MFFIYLPKQIFKKKPDYIVSPNKNSFKCRIAGVAHNKFALRLSQRSFRTKLFMSHVKFCSELTSKPVSQSSNEIN